MKLRHFLPNYQLDEVRMSPSALQKFANSPEAEGIVAGFEAELIFNVDGNDSPEDNWGPNWDADERVTSISDILEFFSYDTFGLGLDRQEYNELKAKLTHDYKEWANNVLHSDVYDSKIKSMIQDYIKEHVVDKDQYFKETLSKLLGNNELVQIALDIESRRYTPAPNGEDSDNWTTAFGALVNTRTMFKDMIARRAEESFKNKDKYYDYANDLAGYSNARPIPSEQLWLSSARIRYASDVYHIYDLRWPVIREVEATDSSDFNVELAQKYATDLSNSLGVKTRVSDQYHSATRDNSTWIFEPDASVHPDRDGDLPVEIVSPPMPLEDCLARMEEFFKWANDNNAYANETTGFHMGVSLPSIGGDVDYIKLALFLGDEHVLQEFGRSFNSYTKSAMKRIQERVNLGAVYIPDAFDLMKKGLVDLAYSVIMKDNTFDKYSSINPHNTAYVEFRSAGNKDYFHDIRKLQNTLLRYAMAMSIAGNPQAERQEYYKKLYKLVSVNTGDTSIDLFSKYASGNITRDELIKKWTNLVLRSGSTSAQRAAAAKRISSKQPAGAESASRSSSPQQRFTGTWRVILGGEEVTTVPGATQGLANAAAMAWIRNQGPEFLSSRNTQEVEVYPIYR